MRLRDRICLALVPALVSCSWARFDEVGENTPVVLLKRPKQIRSGFGSSLVGFSTQERGVLFVGGSPGRSTAALYDLGLGTKPGIEATGTNFCLNEGDDVCFLGQSLAALGPATLTDGELAKECYAVGVGSTETAPPLGVVVECETDELERVIYSLEVPEAFAEELALSIEDGEPEVVSFASSQISPRALLAGSPRHGLAWFYPSSDSGAVPASLVPPGTVEDDYGATVAAMDLEAERLFAVGAPEAGQVHLFAAGPEPEPRYVGCLGGAEGFGRALAAGPVTRGDGAPELVISDASTVYVLSGPELLALDGGSEECVAPTVPEGALVATLECGSDPDVSGCDASDFGRALAVGDLDGDGDGEVAVGAPGMKVRDIAGAGAILIYDVDASRDTDVTEIRFVSSAARDDGLGTALAVASLGERDLLAASGPGGGKTALFYCLDLLPTELRDARCR